MTFHGKIAVVTGASGALGSVIAKHLYSAGASLALPLHSLDSPNIPRGEQGGARVFVHRTDLTVEPEVEGFFAQVVSTMGTVDVLVHAAGGFSGGTPVADVRLEEWENMLTLNLRTAFLVSRSALRVMRSRNSGRIICIAASAGVTPAARRAPYAISKRGVITLTESIAEEVKGTGITANAIAPSIILTDANRKSMPGADFSKWVTPEEIAVLVAFLCSDQARSISGNVIRIYGGV